MKERDREVIKIKILFNLIIYRSSRVISLRIKRLVRAKMLTRMVSTSLKIPLNSLLIQLTYRITVLLTKENKVTPLKKKKNASQRVLKREM